MRVLAIVLVFRELMTRFDFFLTILELYIIHTYHEYITK